MGNQEIDWSLVRSRFEVEIDGFEPMVVEIPWGITLIGAVFQVYAVRTSKTVIGDDLIDRISDAEWDPERGYLKVVIKGYPEVWLSDEATEKEVPLCVHCGKPAIKNSLYCRNHIPRAVEESTEFYRRPGGR